MKLLITTLFIFSVSIIATAQTECPSGFVCISTAAANVAASNARELEAQKEKVKVLEQGLAEKDKSIAELKSLNDKNVESLKEALKRTEIELATRTGQLISRESEVVRQSAIITAMIPMLRKKKIGIFNIF